MERGGLEGPFGIVLRRLRVDAGLSQEDLAERAGIHPNYVILLERGTSSPSLSAITLLARALGQRPSELVAAAELEAAG
jgi:transcriptional regulator with XRE-family HTH domain